MIWCKMCWIYGNGPPPSPSSSTSSLNGSRSRQLTQYATRPTSLVLSFFLSIENVREKEGGIKWTRDELKHQSIYPLLLLLLLSISAAARAHLLTNTHYGCCTRPRTSLLKYKKKIQIAFIFPFTSVSIIYRASVRHTLFFFSPSFSNLLPIVHWKSFVSVIYG